MQEFIEWIETLDMAAISAWLAAFMALYGGQIIAVIITLIKLAVSRFNYNKAITELKLEYDAKQEEQYNKLQQIVVSSLDNLTKEVLAANEASQKERLEAINNVAASTDEALAEVKETIKSFDEIAAEANA